jgi:hypothetical protein
MNLMMKLELTLSIVGSADENGTTLMMKLELTLNKKKLFIHFSAYLAPEVCSQNKISQNKICHF